MFRLITRRRPNIVLMLGQHVGPDDGPTRKQHWVDVSYYLVTRYNFNLVDIQILQRNALG